jgi:hypothetical protein
MKNCLSLLSCGLLASVAAWAFWHFAGDDAFSVLTTIVLLALILDNRRLRQRLNKSETDQPSR